jgi:hypothetical protein
MRLRADQVSDGEVAQALIGDLGAYLAHHRR